MNKQDRFEFQSIDTTLTALLVIGFAVGGVTAAVVWLIHSMLG